ncbi:peptidoglycan DD-metalloendopeptidase family protein [Acuticoccus sp. M5D2P5]|uniref:peptidoglycan DD-metalloendopeptidase family protein n=1 Tax=Acuticoccus kalidii TaxID=2910977 RepID=UPI001F2A251B|nr:peptidoglycan DD-metalloendopeptidase family protein [Acuticoccus kalidii]MCF3933055.1 peptidoglycan DD-metalloendopeptidase family protein [Acuticoccus kalidii]
MGDGPLFAGSAAQQQTGAIESTDLAPMGGPTALAAHNATGTIKTPQALKARGWSVEGAPIVEVTSADTATTLSQGYGVPVNVILEANGLTNAEQIRAGQRLVIPTYTYRDQPTVTPEEATATVVASSNLLGAPATTLNEQAQEARYTVKPGDTLYSISTSHGVSQADVARLNGLPSNGTVQLGQTLRIPNQANIAAQEPTKETQVASLPPEQNAGQTMTDATPDVAQERETIANATPTVSEPAAPGVASAGASGFRWPVRGRIIAGFGVQADGARNEGINLAVPAGTPVLAAEEGTVIYAGSELEGYGNLVLVQHKDDWVSAYAHNDQLKVQRGDKVKRGQLIANVGKTGSVDQPQLHFELRRKSKPVDPLPHLSGA